MNLPITIDFRMHRNSGIGRFITNLVENLYARKFKLHLLTASEDISLLTGQCPQARFNAWDSGLFSLRSQLGHPAYREGTIIHAPHFNHPLFAPPPDVLTIYDMFAFQYPGFFSKKRLLGLKVLLPILLKRARFVHCISQYTAECLTEFFPAVSRKIRVIHLGVEPRFHPRPRTGNSYDHPYFLYIGNLSPHKNLTRLVEAFASFSHDEQQHHLIIVGKDFKGQKTIIEELIQAKELQDRIFILSGLDDERLLDLYSNATALVHPSLAEGFGFTPLEAMACGTPVLVSRAGSLPEVCGDAALYFDPLKPEEIAARMTQIVQEKNLRLEMIERGKARAKEFTWEKCVDGIVELYREAAAKK